MKTTPLFFGFFLFIAVVTNAQFSGGTGTTEDPFQITTKADLDTLSHNPSYWDKHFIQTTDIVFTSSDFQKGGAFYNEGAGFSPIGNSKNGFKGSYNGQGHVIDSLYINRPAQDSISFFGVLSFSATIDNLGLTNVNITGHNAVGGFCGFNHAGTTNNCYATGSVSGKGNNTGGFCGYSYEGNIRNCYYTGSVYGKSLVGGFCGSNKVRSCISIFNNAPINNCHSTGIVTGIDNIGGFCGVNEGTIHNCYAKGSVLGEGEFIGGFCGENKGDIRYCHATGNSSGKGVVGGFCGVNYDYISKSYATGSVSGNSEKGGFCGENKGDIRYCHATGNISGKKGKTGGFCGDNQNYISNCYAIGNVSTTGSAGGFCGDNSSTINNCYTMGRVSTEGEPAGGFCWNNSGTIRNCFATGNVSAIGNILGGVGGFCGSNKKGTINNNFWDIQTSGLTKSSGGTGKTTIEMKDQSTFTDVAWDFTDAWQMSSCINDGYPSLRVFGLLNTIPNSNSSSHFSVTACYSYTSPSGKYRWTTSGIYMDRIPNAAGCDSVIIVDLTIQSSVSDITTSLKDNTITANNAHAGYQWLDCDDNYAVIPNETGRSFTPTSNGHYAVELSENGCVDTSDCVAITRVAVVNHSFEEELIAYPNPTNGDFTIDLGKEYSEVQMSITDITGKTIETKKFTQAQVIKLTLPPEASGVYFVSIKTTEKNAVIRLIKE